MDPLAQRWLVLFSLSLSLLKLPKAAKTFWTCLNGTNGGSICPCHSLMAAWYKKQYSVSFRKAFVISAIAANPSIVSSVRMKMMQLIAASVLSEQKGGEETTGKKLQIGTGNSRKVLMMKWKLKTASGAPDLNRNTLEEEENVRAGVHGYQTHALKTHSNEALGNRRYYSEQIHSRVH